MDPLSVTASLIAVIQLTGMVISATYNYRKGVKSAPQDAARIIQDLTGLSHVLENLLQLIEKEKSTNDLTRLAALKGLTEPDGPLELCQKMLEHLNAKLQPDSGWRAVKQSLMWPLKQEYTQKTLDEIAKTKATFDLALSIDQVSLALETKDGIDALTSSFQSYRLDEKRKAIFAAFSPTDATVNHREACRKHQQGTGEWFITSDQYVAWVAKVDSFLWINGIPGCGKTVLCSVVIEDLLRNHQPNKAQAAVAYYYFNFQTKEEQQFVNLLRSIVLQLACQCPALPTSVGNLEWEFKRSSPTFSVEYLTSIFRELFSSFRDVYVVVDALDECEQTDEALRWIQDVVQNKDGKLHLAVSSRQDQRFRNALEPYAMSTINLNESTFVMDIQLYIRARLSADPRMQKWPPNVRDDVERSLLANAGGLFRWVDCQLDVLRKCLRINNIKNVLDTAPRTLNETYDRIMASIDEAYVEDACKILQWLVFSARPLQTNELNEVLAFDRSDQHNPWFNPDLRLPLLDDVLNVCASLVTVTDQKTSTDPSDLSIETSEVRLAHRSVKDYLVSHHIKSGPSVRFAQEAQLAHSVITECCLVYLVQFQSPLDQTMLQEFPLAQYAAKFWTEHYRLSGVSDDAGLQVIPSRLALQLLTGEFEYRNCCLLYNPDKRWRGVELGKDPGIPTLYYASFTGLWRMIKPLVAHGADPNEDCAGCYFGDALSAAAYKGDEASVRALLEVKADINGATWEGHYGSPIASAASQGHTAIVKLLASQGADLDQRGEEGQGPALYHAVDSRHLETAKMLLELGADADACAGMSGVVYAINIAARRNDQELVLLLFLKVSDWVATRVLDEIASVGNRTLFESVLQTERGKRLGLGPAARAGWGDVVDSMLDESSEDEISVQLRGKALHQAAANGSLEITQTLYETMDPTAITLYKELSAAVSAAARNGHTLVVQYLLDRGADTSSQQCQYALCEAVEKGHLSTVQVLLNAGVDPNSHSEKWSRLDKMSALYIAVNYMHLEIARLLLSFCANPTTVYEDISALTRSIEKGHGTMFDLLLEAGASTGVVRTKEARYDTLVLPIHYAAYSGNVHILRKLLDTCLAGVDDVQIPDGWTALFHAAKAGHHDFLRVLIHDYHADINRRANGATLAIHTAAYHNHGKCVEVFLDAGLDVDVRGRAGRTSLHWAAQEGSIDAVRVLLNRGADVLIEEDDTFMKAVDVASAKALRLAEEAAERQKSGYSYWKQPRDDNYEPIVEMLKERANQL